MLLLAAVPSVFAFQTPPAQEAVYPPPPWHLVDIWWDLGEDRPFESLSLDVTVSDSVPETVNLYIAPMGLAHLDKTPFYGGLQTQADGYTLADQRLRKIGPGLIFSMWGERSHDAIRVAPGGFCQSSGHEGDFISVRRPFSWSKGRYIYKVAEADRVTLDGKPYTWIAATVHSLEKHDDTLIGSLRFPGQNLNLSRHMASFVEIYGPRRPLDQIPKLTVTLDHLQVDGAPVHKPSAVVEYPEGVPDYAVARGHDSAVVITVGEPISNRGKRRVDLLTDSASHPVTETLIGKFELLAIYTYAKALRNGLPETEAKERAITAAIMGARARGSSRGGSGSKDDTNVSQKASSKAKKQAITAEMYDHQISDRLGESYSKTLLPTIIQLERARLTYQEIKELLAMPAEVGAKITVGQFQKAVSNYRNRLR
jgi:hypothetical protein